MPCNLSFKKPRSEEFKPKKYTELKTLNAHTTHTKMKEKKEIGSEYFNNRGKTTATPVTIPPLTTTCLK